MRIAILTYVFSWEYGVARVIAAQLPSLLAAGMKVDIFACNASDEMKVAGVQVVRIPTHLRGLRQALDSGGYDVVIAHTHPFYRLLPHLHPGMATIAYEHGTPPPSFFPGEEAARLDEKNGLLEQVYSRVSQVVAISSFIAKDIGWPKALVLYNGADHLSKEHRIEVVQGARSLVNDAMQLLCVSRLGEKESLYKGFDLLARLAKELGDGWNVVLAGRGNAEDKKRLESSGLHVFLCPSDAELANLYARSHALVSFSQWEGFNLPLAEAGFFQTPAFALDLGAHREVTPFCFETFEKMAAYLASSTPTSLAKDGRRMREAVAPFVWENNGSKLRHEIERLAKGANTPPRRVDFFIRIGFWRFREFVRKMVWRRA